MYNRKNKKVGDIREGDTRNFINVYKNGRSLTLGIPKASNPNKKIYVKSDDGVSYVSPSEGQQLLGQTFGRLGGYSNSQKALSSSSSYGCCSHCSKTLQGNRSKSHCTACWRAGHR